MKTKTFNSSTSKPNDKPRPGDKNLGFYHYIQLYEIEYGDNTEEVEV